MRVHLLSRANKAKGDFRRFLKLYGVKVANKLWYVALQAQRNRQRSKKKKAQRNRPCLVIEGYGKLLFIFNYVHHGLIVRAFSAVIFNELHVRVHAFQSLICVWSVTRELVY